MRFAFAAITILVSTCHVDYWKFSIQFTDFCFC